MKWNIGEIMILTYLSHPLLIPERMEKRGSSFSYLVHRFKKVIFLVPLLLGGITLFSLFDSSQKERKSFWFFKHPTSFSFERSFFGSDSNLIRDFHDVYMISIMVIISVFVFFLFFGKDIFKENRKKRISRFVMEIMWILFPLSILFFIGLPSMGILYELEDSNGKETSFSVKTTGFQWFWTYERGGRLTESYMVNMEEEDSPRNLTRDGYLSLPKNELIRNFITSKDVMHRWALPSLKIKMDAIPGRLNQISINLESPSGVETLVGQCSELCGVNHRFIPIVVKTI